MHKGVHLQLGNEWHVSFIHCTSPVKSVSVYVKVTSNIATKLDFYSISLTKSIIINRYDLCSVV